MEDYTKKELGIRIYTMRTQLGKSIAEFAELLEIQKDDLEKIEAGKRCLKVNECLRLLRGTNQTVQYFDDLVPIKKQRKPRKVSSKYKERNANIILESKMGMGHAEIAKEYSISRQRVDAIVKTYSF